MRKAQKNKTSNDTIVEKNELKSLIIIIVIVSAIFLVFYGITLLTSKKHETKHTTEVKEETIQYDEIMIGQILNQNEKQYYVLIKNSKNVYNNLFTTYLKSYASSENSIKYYTADLDNSLNSSYVANDTKIDKTNFYNSKFGDTTLILIKNKKVNKTYTSDEEILNVLKQLVA